MQLFAVGVIYLKRHGLAVVADSLRRLPVAVKRLYKCERILVCRRLRQIDLRDVVADIVVQHIEVVFHRVLHAETSDKQQHTAEDADQGHGAACLVTDDVTEVPLCAEGQLVPKRQSFDGALSHHLRRVRTKGVRRRTSEHTLYGQVADERQERNGQDDDGDAEGRHHKAPVGDVEVCGHHSVRTHDDGCHRIADHNSEERSHESDEQTVGGVVTQYPPVTEAERLEGAYLHLFGGGNAVHGRDHRQNRNGKEQHGQDRPHRLALLRLALRSGIGVVFALVGDQNGGADRLAHGVFKLDLAHVGDDVYLRIKRRAESAFQLFGAYVRKAERLIVGHELIVVGNAYHVFAALCKTYDLAGDLRTLIHKGQRIAEADAVCVGKLIRKPNAVGACVVVRSARYIHRRNVVIFRDVQGNGLLRVLYADVHREVSRRSVHTAYALYGGNIVLRKARIGVDTEVGVVRLFKEVGGVGLDALPFDVEAEEDADADGDHYYH